MNFTLEGAQFGQTDGVHRLRKYEICADFCVGLAWDGCLDLVRTVFSAPRQQEESLMGCRPLQGSALMGTFPRAYARG